MSKKSYVNIADEGIEYAFVPVKERRKTTYTYQIDRSLLHLRDSLEDLERTNYPEEINNRLRNFINDIDKLIFPNCPHGMDLERTKLIYIEDYEEFIPLSKREYF